MPEPYFAAEGLTLYLGDCRDVMAAMEPDSIDAICTDPPYGIHFMGKAWDRPRIERRTEQRNTANLSPARKAAGRTTAGFGGSVHAGAYDLSLSGNRAFQAWCEQWAAEALRVAKPGSHMVVFGSPRTYHRLACGVEDAGWEIRDGLQWLFGSGFPKSLNVGEGRGTALKPAYEPVILARKPLAGTVAQNVQEHGTGGLNIDATRIGTGGDKGDWPITKRDPADRVATSARNAIATDNNSGRWPANVVLDEEAARLLDEAVGERTSGKMMPTHTTAGRDIYGQDKQGGFTTMETYGDTGGPSRFFYTAKSSRSEREAGLGDMPAVRRSDGREKDIENPRLRTTTRKNHHPTVKPVSLMAWLVRLITPPGGVVLDPFMGSGSTRIAAQMEARSFVGIELDAEYIEIARRRLAQHGLPLEMTP